jgi:hypothetical protein
MTETVQSMRDDIAFMRALAEDGRGGVFGGEAMIGAGLIYGAASAYSWAALSGVLHASWAPAGIGWSWLGASVVFAGLLVALRRGRPMSSASRIGKTAWSSIGLAIWTICLGVGLTAWQTRDGVVLSLIPPMVLALYGSGWMVAAAVFRVAWTRWVALACLAASLALAALAGRPEQYLLFAAALLLLASAPGVVLARRAHAGA